MTVSNQSHKIGPTTGVGSVATYNYPYRVDADSHLKVVTTVISTGVETTLTQGVDYTLSGGTAPYLSGVDVTLTAGNLPATKTITIYRDTPLSQEVDLGAQEDLPEESVELGIDKPVLMLQELQGGLDRTLRVPVSTNLSTVSTVIPAPSAGKALIGKSGGTGWENSTSDFDTIVADATTQATAAATSASAASASATAAASSASSASTSASNASASATAAAASAASNNIATPVASKHGALLYQNDDDDGYNLLTTQGTSGYPLLSSGADAAPAFGQVPTAGITDDAVTAAKLADTAVTPGSYTLASITVDQQGRLTAASSGTVSNGGEWEYVSTATLSSDATIDIIDLENTDYKFVFDGVKTTNDQTAAWMRLSNDNGSTFKAGASDYHWTGDYKAIGSTTSISDTADSEIEIIAAGLGGTTGGWGNASTEFAVAEVILKNNGGSGRPLVEVFCSYINSLGNLVKQELAGFYVTGALDVDAVRFGISAASYASGSIHIYKRVTA